ncbi:MAG TPA: DUF2953 domain-containing protein [Syntrophomonadaceae bacterium]|nr:DUF2953 domain-containing protein [Syntrophomonadaceae bacterium]
MLFLYCAVLWTLINLAVALVPLHGRMDAHLELNRAGLDLSIDIARPLGKRTVQVLIKGPEWADQSFIISSRWQFPGRPQSSKRSFLRILKEEDVFSSPGPIQLSKLLTQSTIFKLILRFLILKKIEWKTLVGSGDAMKTALASGALWAGKGLLISELSFQGHIRDLNILVQPDFYQEIFESRLHCIFKMRIVHIIFVEAYILVQKARGRL